MVVGHISKRQRVCVGELLRAKIRGGWRFSRCAVRGAKATPQGCYVSKGGCIWCAIHGQRWWVPILQVRCVGADFSDPVDLPADLNMQICGCDALRRECTVGASGLAGRAPSGCRPPQTFGVQTSGVQTFGMQSGVQTFGIQRPSGRPPACRPSGCRPPASDLRCQSIQSEFEWGCPVPSLRVRTFGVRRMTTQPAGPMGLRLHAAVP